MPDIDKDTIYLVPAAFKQQFSKAMIHNGLDPEHYFRKVGLPEFGPSDPQALLPEKPFFRLVNMVAIEQGVSNFGSQVAELTPWTQVASLVPLLRQSETLGDLLASFCESASDQSKMLRFYLEEAGADTYFWYEGIKLISNDVQMELYRLTSMILLVQEATGARWRPTRLWMNAKENDAVQSCSLLRTSAYTFDSRRCGFSIPSSFLSLSLRNRHDYKGAEFQKEISTDFIESIREIIRSYVNFKNCRLEDISRITDLPLRTLQRRLKLIGTSFNDILNEEKQEMAKSKLADSSLNISHIASQLGYSDTSHFDRAFQRWVGMSPREYRKSIQ